MNINNINKYWYLKKNKKIGSLIRIWVSLILRIVRGGQVPGLLYTVNIKWVNCNERVKFEFNDTVSYIRNFFDSDRRRSRALRDDVFIFCRHLRFYLHQLAE